MTCVEVDAGAGVVLVDDSVVDVGEGESVVVSMVVVVVGDVVVVGSTLEVVSAAVGMPETVDSHPVKKSVLARTPAPNKASRLFRVAVTAVREPSAAGSLFAVPISGFFFIWSSPQ